VNLALLFVFLGIVKI